MLQSATEKKAFFSAALFGFLLWGFSQILTGALEPWDGNILLYTALLFVIGCVVSLLFKVPAKIVYLGAVAGQIFYMCANALLQSAGIMPGDSAFIGLGIPLLFIYSLPVWLGAYLVLGVKKIMNG